MAANYRVHLITNGQPPLDINDYDDTTHTGNYATNVVGLYDGGQRQGVISDGYRSGAALVSEDGHLLPRQVVLQVTIMAGWPPGANPIRGAAHNAARDALLRALPVRGLVTLRTEYLGTDGYWDIAGYVTNPVWTEGTPIYQVTLTAPDPLLTNTLVATRVEHLPWFSSGPTKHEDKTFTVDVGGNYDALLLVTITPTQGKTDRWNSMREYTITNARNADLAAQAVPLPFDFAWHLTNAVIRPDGGDIRVVANNVEINRWWSDPIADATQIWVKVDLPALAAITVQVIFNNLDGGTAGWVNSTAGPIFDLAASTGTTRRFAGAFMDPPNTGSPHSEQWNAHNPGTGFVPLQRHQGSPWEQDPGNTAAFNAAGGEVLVAGEIQGYAGMAYHEPCGITSVSHHGYTQLDPALLKLAMRARNFDGSWQTDPWALTADTHSGLAEYGPVITGLPQEAEAVVVALRSTSVHTAPGGYLGGADRVTLSLSAPPVVSGNTGTGSGGIVTVYYLEFTITNETTGESVYLFGIVTRAGSDWQSVVLDPAPNTQAVTMAGTPFYYAFRTNFPIRPDWLRLVSGTNTITIHDIAVDGLDVTLAWQARRL